MPIDVSYREVDPEGIVREAASVIMEHTRDGQIRHLASAILILIELARGSLSSSATTVQH